MTINFKEQFVVFQSDIERKFRHSRFGRFYGITGRGSLRQIDRIYALQRYITKMARNSGVGASLEVKFFLSIPFSIRYGYNGKIL